MNNSYYDNKTLKKLHGVEIEILNEFVKVCEEHNLTYFLVGGTYLGAVRHSGFIPWDDDIDVGMPRCDYDKFISIFSKMKNDKYYLDCFETNKDYYLPFAKIKRNNTLFDESETHHINNHKGIFIDIFPFENVDNYKSIKFRIKAILSQSISECMFYRNKIKLLKNCRNKIIVLIMCMFSKKRLMIWQKKVNTYCKDNNSKYLCVIGSGYGYRREINLRKDILPVRKLKFEQEEYNCMNSNVYLEKLYGDYMVLPPIEKRHTHKPLDIKFED